MVQGRDDFAHVLAECERDQVAGVFLSAAYMTDEDYASFWNFNIPFIVCDQDFGDLRTDNIILNYDYNLNEPISYPYEGTPCDSSVLTKENFLQYNGKAPGNDWDYRRFRPEHFQLLERNVQALQELEIEADIIVMHPYDRWGFSQMDAESDDLYWKYVIARLGV